MIGLALLLAGGFAVNKFLERALPLPLRNIVAILGGAGDLGSLAAGGNQELMLLKEGISVPRVLGQQPLIARPLPRLPMPDHPYLLDELASGGVHADSYNSSVTPHAGPRGIAPVASYHPVVDGDDLSMCTPLLVTPAGNLASACVGLGRPSEVVLFDPKDDFRIIDQISTADPADMGFMQPGGGWYTQLDNQGRALVMVPGQKFRAYSIDESDGESASESEGESVNESTDSPEWTIDTEINLPLEADEHLIDVRPDWQNNLWFSTGHGSVGVIDAESGAIQRIHAPDGEIGAAALAIIPDAVFYLSTRAIYRLELSDAGEARIRWRYEYGQSSSKNGDLTAPTVLDGGDLIAIGVNDGGPQGKVLVLKTSAEDMSQNERRVCEHPIFKPGKSFLDNTFVGYDKSLVVQNNAGGLFFDLVEYEPGLARIDIRDDYSGCDTVWEDYSVSSQVPPKLSTGDGHVYQYSRRIGTGEDIHAWYLSAHDFETGEPVSELFIGSGERLDNPMLSIDFLPGGEMVAGVRNGIVVLRDTIP